MSVPPVPAAEIARLANRLRELDDERERIAARLGELHRQQAGSPTIVVRSVAAPSTAASVPSSSSAKVALFASLFRGRSDVYPRFWANDRKGTKGYSPACLNEWQRPICQKPKVRCGECRNQSFEPVTPQVIRDHLQGKHVIGVYPLLPDERCHLLAVDFDKGSWREDVAAFAETCRLVGVPTAIERSRSGNGAHAWFFFEEPIPATVARKVGCYLLTETMARRSGLGMDSYDRLFPNQDTMPRGGFGNLIALPLQHEARKNGNTAFLGDDLEPLPDQWAFLAGIQRIPSNSAELIVAEAQRQGRVLGVRFAPAENEATPWAPLPSGKPRTPVAREPGPESVTCVRANRFFVERHSLPAGLVTDLRRTASFQNPEFYKKQAMRLSTAGTPRVISCATEDGPFIGLPRGCEMAMTQSLVRKGVVDDLVAGYGHLVVDECHHVSAVSFERVLSEVKARYVLGLTATPGRRDGHEPIIEMQLGPARFTFTAKAAAEARGFQHRLLVRETGFDGSWKTGDPIQDLYASMAKNDVRNALILDDAIGALDAGRSPLLLTERRDHLEFFVEKPRPMTRHLVTLHGGLSPKERREALQQLAEIPAFEERLVVATGRYVGEGFDDPRLDTLILALPVAWKGTVVQYAGRLHRQQAGKSEVRIHDYRDGKIPVLVRMLEKRLRAYLAMGYETEDVEARTAESEPVVEYEESHG